VGAVVIVAVAVWLLAKVNPRFSAAQGAVFTAAAISAAYATHIALDWLGKDTAPPFGLTALWPFSSAFYISGADLFMEISRRYWKSDEFIVGNIRAGAWELLVVGPIAAVAYYVARKKAS
jgi:hypothetical protein